MLVEKRLETAFRGYRSITEEVKEAVAESGVEEGICTVFLPEEETGLSITSFWDERGLLDLLDEIERNIPARVNYKNQFSPFNASGRVKGAVVGRSTTLLIHGGKLLLGSSQGLVFLEFDGPRERRYCIQVEARKLKLSRHQVNSEYGKRKRRERGKLPHLPAAFYGRPSAWRRVRGGTDQYHGRSGAYGADKGGF